MHVLSRLCHGFRHWFSFPVADGFSLLLNNFKLVAKNNLLCGTYQLAYAFMDACSAYEPRPHLFVDLNAGYNYIWQAQNGDPTRVCRYSKTPDKYGDTQASAWSRALATAWSHAHRNNGV